MKSIPDKFVVWGASIIVTAVMAVGFLFMTFETSADANKNNDHFDARLDRLEQKIDTILEQQHVSN